MPCYGYTMTSFLITQTNLLVVRYGQFSNRIHGKAIWLTIPLGFYGDFLGGRDTQDASIWNVNHIQIARRCANRTFEKDVLKGPTETAAPF
jgi:hypothetical protein